MKKMSMEKQRQRSALEASAWLSVVRTYEECARRYARMLEHFDLTASQFDALLAIQFLGPDALPKFIAERLLVTRPNVTGLLRRLEERELIRMTPHSSDGRAMLCRLTPRGQRSLAAAQGAARRFVRTQTAAFEDQELADMEVLMGDMLRQLRVLDPDALALGEQNPAPRITRHSSPGSRRGASTVSG